MAVSSQPQQAIEIPKIFTKDMSNEQLALWLSHHQKLVGDFDEDINILKGIHAMLCVTSLIYTEYECYRGKNKWPQLLEFE